MTHEISEKVPDSIPIGKPIANTTAYVIQNKELCGIKVPGELCLGGGGLARGYLNQKELTQKKFIISPFDEKEILYCTGDLVRWCENGTMEYLGRIDNQVKIRGFRIELSEIRKRLLDIQNIVEAEVIVQTERGDKVLCAYITLKKEIPVKSIREQLRALLPEYMIPAYITIMKRLPVTKNGKIDTKALPKPQIVDRYIKRKPETVIQKNIHDVFSEILNIGQIGIDEDFYDLGGDSIKAIRMVSRLREYGYTISLKNILKLRTIAKISLVVNQDKIAREEQDEISGVVNLTPVQKIFFNTQMKNPNHFNQSIMLKFIERVDEQFLSIALDKIAEHHDMLRVLYNGKQKIRTVNEFGHIPLDIYEINPNFDDDQLYQYIEEKSSIAQGSLDLRTGPVFKAVLYKAPGEDYLLLVCHHLLVDGVSWQILLEDLKSAYNAQKNQKKISFPQKTVSYLKWSNMLYSYSQSPRAVSELSYWKRIEAEMHESRFSLGNPDIDKENIVSLSINKKLTKSLLDLASYNQGINVKEILLTALARSIQKISEKDIISINLEGHGRESLDDTISADRTIGWFTNIYPIVLKNMGGSIENDMLCIKKILSEVPNGGMGYGALNAYTGLLTGISPEVTFNYLGEFGTYVNTEELFCMSDLPKGMDIDPKNYFGTPISVNILITDERLQFNVWYNNMVTNKEFVIGMISTVKRNLSDIVTYYMEKNHKMETIALDDYYRTEIISEYIPTTIQNLFLVLGKQGVVENKFQIVCDNYDKLIYAIKNVIREQSAFRTSYRKGTNGFILCEHTSNIDYKITYTDTNSVLDSDYKIQMGDMDIDDNCKQNQNYPLYKLMVIKESKNQYTILLNISHSIWDKKSSMIFIDSIQKYLISNIYEKIEKLSNVANLVHRSINLFKQENSKRLEWLEKFIINRNLYLNNEQDNKIIRYEIARIPLEKQDRECYNNEQWNFMLGIVRRIIELNNCQKSVYDLPIYLVYENRSYFGKDFTDMIGPFIDLVPMSLPYNISEEICPADKEFTDIMNLKRVKLPSIIDLLGEQKNACSIGQVYSVNYQGIFGLSDSEFCELERQVALKGAESGYEIIINELNGDLVLIYPVTKSCKEDIKKQIIDKCRSITKSFIYRRNK